jgi:thiol-disulfide isomerase/thioredoxin
VGGRRAARIAALISLLTLCAVVAAASWDAYRAPRAAAGGAAPRFDLTRIDGGGTLALSALEGRVVVLNFFASWCDPCRAEAGVLARLAERYGSGVVVVGIATNDDPADARAFADAHGLAYPLLRADDAVLAAYEVRGLPETVFIDAAGEVSGRPVAGPLDRALAARRVEQALADGSGS